MKNKRLLPLYLSRKRKERFFPFWLFSNDGTRDTIEFFSLLLLPFSVIPGDGRVEEPEQTAMVLME